MKKFHRDVERLIGRLASEQAELINEMCYLPKDSYGFQIRNLRR